MEWNGNTELFHSCSHSRLLYDLGRCFSHLGRQTWVYSWEKTHGCSLTNTIKGRAEKSLTCAGFLDWHAAVGRALPKELLTEGWLKASIRWASMGSALSCASGEQGVTHSGHAPDSALTLRASAQGTQREFSGGKFGQWVVSFSHSRGG